MGSGRRHHRGGHRPARRPGWLHGLRQQRCPGGEVPPGARRALGPGRRRAGRLLTVSACCVDPKHPGELRTRTDRLQRCSAERSDVEHCLKLLADKAIPLVQGAPAPSSRTTGADPPLGPVDTSAPAAPAGAPVPPCPAGRPGRRARRRRRRPRCRRLGCRVRRPGPHLRRAAGRRVAASRSTGGCWSAWPCLAEGGPVADVGCGPGRRGVPPRCRRCRGDRVRPVARHGARGLPRLPRAGTGGGRPQSPARSGQRAPRMGRHRGLVLARAPRGLGVLRPPSTACLVRWHRAVGGGRARGRRGPPTRPSCGTRPSTCTSCSTRGAGVPRRRPHARQWYRRGPLSGAEAETERLYVLGRCPAEPPERRSAAVLAEGEDAVREQDQVAIVPRGRPW